MDRVLVVPLAMEGELTRRGCAKGMVLGAQTAQEGVDKALAKAGAVTVVHDGRNPGFLMTRSMMAALSAVSCGVAGLVISGADLRRGLGCRDSDCKACS